MKKIFVAVGFIIVGYSLTVNGQATPARSKGSSTTSITRPTPSPCYICPPGQPGRDGRDGAPGTCPSDCCPSGGGGGAERGEEVVYFVHTEISATCGVDTIDGVESAVCIGDFSTRPPCDSPGDIHMMASAKFNVSVTPHLACDPRGTGYSIPAPSPCTVRIVMACARASLEGLR